MIDPAVLVRDGERRPFGRYAANLFVRALFVLLVLLALYPLLVGGIAPEAAYERCTEENAAIWQAFLAQFPDGKVPENYDPLAMPRGLRCPPKPGLLGGFAQEYDRLRRPATSP